MKCWCGHEKQNHWRDYQGITYNCSICDCQEFRARPEVTAADREWLKGYSDVARMLPDDIERYGIESSKGLMKANIALAATTNGGNSASGSFSYEMWKSPYGQGRACAAADAFGL